MGWNNDDQHEEEHRDEHRGGPVIRIGSVGESAYDVRGDLRVEVALTVPRPRTSMDNGTAVRPPAA
jgi:hypothetical protein